MSNRTDEILRQASFSKEDLITLLQTNKEDRNKIFTHAAKVKTEQL